MLQLSRNRMTRSAVVLSAAAVVVACGGGQQGGPAADRMRCPAAAPKTRPLDLAAGLSGRIVWSSDRQGGNLELYVMGADGSGHRRLTRTAAHEATPAWSPDGRRIAFAALSELDDSAPAWIAVMNADGSGMRALTSREPGLGSPTWSPDGSRIAFAGPGGEIHVMRADGSGRHRLGDVAGSDVWPSWSPDGERILVTSGSFSSPRLWTVRADGSAPEQVSDVVGEEGAWSPNGARIAFASTRDGSPGARDPVDWNEEIYVMRADGSGLTRLTRIAGNEHWPPAWSPDGRHIAFTSDGCRRSRTSSSPTSAGRCSSTRPTTRRTTCSPPGMSDRPETADSRRRRGSLVMTGSRLFGAVNSRRLRFPVGG
jgi:Tol biopolymer transport system component